MFPFHFIALICNERLIGLGNCIASGVINANPCYALVKNERELVLYIWDMITGETNLNTLLKNMTPVINEGDYVYCTTSSLNNINTDDIIAFFKEQEAVTLILKKETADKLKLEYNYTAAWITLTIHSSLEATGLTAAFATALANENISCNVVAAYYHDHIFVAKKDAERAMLTLRKLAE